MKISMKKYAADPGDTEVVIPDSVTSIRRAFEGCHSLTSIVIPERVTRCVPDDMIYACPNIAVIKLHPDDPALRRYFSKYRCSIGTALHKASQYSTAPGTPTGSPPTRSTAISHLRRSISSMRSFSFCSITSTTSSASQSRGTGSVYSISGLTEAFLSWYTGSINNVKQEVHHG